ncbi:uncharacterized protein LOC144665176 [Oculina patagonica]
MGSAIGIARGTDGRNKTVVTHLRQENVRLQARIERLSAESTRLKTEINTLLKEKELTTCNIHGGHLHCNSPTPNANETGIASEQENVVAPASFTEQVLQMELETLKKENYWLARELENLKSKDACAEGSDGVCGRKNEAEQNTWK